MKKAMGEMTPLEKAEIAELRAMLMAQQQGRD